jgi:hypothetical protein
VLQIIKPALFGLFSKRFELKRSNEVPTRRNISGALDFLPPKDLKFCKLRSDDIMSHTQRLRILLTSLFLLSFKPVFAQAPLPSLPDIESAGSLGEDLFLQSGATGMVLVVVRDSQVFFRGYGETAPNSQKPPTEDSLLRLCSLTKIFTTEVLTKLVMDRTVRLNDPLQRFAPRRTIVPKRGQSITLADLAPHTQPRPSL